MDSMGIACVHKNMSSWVMILAALYGLLLVANIKNISLFPLTAV